MAARTRADLHATDADAATLEREAVACNVLAYVHLGMAAAGFVPAWTLALTVPVLVPRWMIAVHELFHLRSEREVGLTTRLLPFAFSPLALGYRELLANHRTHHRHMCTPQDTEWYQLAGSRLAGLFNAFTSPEQLWPRWVRAHGLDASLLRDTLLRGALFALLVAGAGWTFLWYWIPARIAFGAGYFVFFYSLHRRGGEFGVYPLELPAGLARLLAVAYGRVVVEATLHHDVHHAQPRIAARHLARSRTGPEAAGR